MVKGFGSLVRIIGEVERTSRRKFDMYKMMIGITAAVLTAGLGMTTVLAENKTTVPTVNYVDENGDGICDNYGSGQCRGNGQGYVDANNDGICDNAGARQCMTSGTCRRGNN